MANEIRFFAIAAVLTVTALSLVGCASSPVKPLHPAKVSGGKLTYRGFSVDVSAVLSGAKLAAIESSVKHQIDIVADSGAKPEVLAFFRNQQIVLTPGAKDGGGHFAPKSREVAVGATIDPPEKPILLHELLHAFHFYVLPQAFQNPDVLRFYSRAKEDHIYPATEVVGGHRRPTYMLTNPLEFFAVTASLYLWDNVDREPHTRQNLKSRQPLYYAWLAHTLTDQTTKSDSVSAIGAHMIDAAYRYADGPDPFPHAPAKTESDVAIPEYSCAPRDTSARILNSATPNDIQKDWSGESWVGLSWSVQVSRSADRNGIKYYQGDLFSPRGTLANHDIFIIANEWICKRLSK